MKKTNFEIQLFNLKHMLICEVMSYVTYRNCMLYEYHIEHGEQSYGIKTNKLFWYFLNGYMNRANEKMKGRSKSLSYGVSWFNHIMDDMESAQFTDGFLIIEDCHSSFVLRDRSGEKHAERMIKFSKDEHRHHEKEQNDNSYT